MLEKSIINLEIKFSHQEDLLDQLNKIVTSQQIVIDKLQQDVLRLKLQQSENAPQNPRSLADDVPPHY